MRYIQWFINAPLVLLALLSFTSMATPQILTILFFSWFLVINGLVGALVQSSYKWGYFTFGLFGLFFIWCVPDYPPPYHSLVCLMFYARYQLLGHVFLFQFRNGDFRFGYLAGSAYISFIWMLYPICWGLSEGSNNISPTSEMVFYGVLDIMSGPVFLLTYMVYLGRFDRPALGATAFGTADRGIYDGLPPQKPAQQPAPQQQPANA